MGASYEVLLTPGTAAPIDITERISLEGLSTLSMLVERNLHDFRCGDVTLTLDNADDFFSDLFSGLTRSDRWRLTVDRDGVRHFFGHIQPFDSIHFDEKGKLVEVTALDLSKLAEETPALSVARSTVDYLITSGSSGSHTLVLVDTTGLLNGDTLHLVDGSNEEDVTVGLVVSSTNLYVVQDLANTYTSAGGATLTSPFYRFKTPDFLVGQLFASIPDIILGTDIQVSAIPSNGIPILMAQETNLLPSTAFPTTIVQRNGKQFVHIASVNGYEQVTHDQAWAAAVNNRYADWSPFRTQAEGEPGTLCIPPTSADEATFGFDYTPGAFVAYKVTDAGGGTLRVDKYTSADGTTWSGASTLVTLSTGIGAAYPFFGGDFDAVRNRFYYFFTKVISFVESYEFGYYDISGASKVVLGTYKMVACRASKEADSIQLLRPGGTNNLEFWRADARIATGTTTSRSDGQFFRTLRYLNGFWYYVDYNKQIPRVHYSGDGFQTEQTIDLADQVTVTNQARLSVVNGTIRIVIEGTPGGIPYYFVMGPVSSWTIDYADFSSANVANAIDDLAILMNAVFFIDQDAVGHFLRRDIAAGTPVATLDGDPVNLTGEPLWLETYDYVEVGMGEAKGSAGQKTSISRNLSVSVDITGTPALASAIAAYLLAFYGMERRLISLELDDDGTILKPLDTVRFRDEDWLVYSLERDLTNYQISLVLLEKAA